MWSGPPSLASSYSKQIAIANAESPSYAHLIWPLKNTV
jgi:hypothetical protein